MDAELIGILDVWFDAAGAVNTAVAGAPATDFAVAPLAQAHVEKQARFIADMMKTPLFELPVAGTTKRTRFEQSAVVSFLLGLLKRALKTELVINIGGNIRGKADYEPGPFTLAQLFAEFAFPTTQVVVPVPGRVIQESIYNTRRGDGERKSFLHCDDRCVLDDANTLLEVNGAPFDPDRVYRLGLYGMILQGMASVEPLCSYARDHLKLPPDDACIGAKELITNVCVRDAWGRLIGIDRWDTDGAGAVSSAEFEAGVTAAFSTLDFNKDGMIQASEIRRHLAEHAEVNVSLRLIETMVQTLDTNGDGKVSREELAALAI